MSGGLPVIRDDFFVSVDSVQANTRTVLRRSHWSPSTSYIFFIHMIIFSHSVILHKLCGWRFWISLPRAVLHCIGESEHSGMDRCCATEAIHLLDDGLNRHNI